MRIAIIGAGAIGGFLAARLAAAQFEVTLVTHGAPFTRLLEASVRADPPALKAA